MSRLPIATLVFFATLFGLPLTQAALELARGERVQALDVIGPLEAPRLRSFERELLEASCLQERAVPTYQELLLRLLRRGNEQAIASTGGWLDYTADVEHVTGPGVLQPGAAGPRAVETLVQFHEVLDAAGVRLLLVPVPTKSSVEPQFLARGGSPVAPGGAENPDTAAWLEELRAAGLELLDLSALLDEARTDDMPLFLPRDTHWTPATMRRVAAAVAARTAELGGLPVPASHAFTTRELRVEGAGDLVGMLNLPPGSDVFEPMQLELEQVQSGDQLWAPTRDAEVLLLGDSFTRVFSDPELELGTSAGLAEHISLALGRPLDVIAMSGGGAAAVRTALARRADGLAGKRVVIWEFTLRELSADADSWRWIELPPPSVPEPDPVPVLEPALGFEVTAELVELSVLDPDFDYAFCLGVFEYRVLEGPHEGPLWVAFPVLEEHQPTKAADFTIGLRQRLVLEPIEEHHDLESTSWIDDTDAGYDIFMAVEWGPAE